MKKIIFTLLLVTMSITSYAQKLQWDVEGGANFAKVTSLSSKVGFHAGIRGTKSLDNVLAPGVYANAGAFLSLKGGEMDLGDWGSTTMNAYYIDIPIHIGYKHAMNDNTKFFVEAGPYFSFGLFGDQKSKTMYDDDDYDWEYEDESQGTFDNTLKRFDFGLGLRAGLEFNKIFFAVGYDAGMIDIYKNDDYDDDLDITGTLKSSNFYVSIGYIF